ncbi:MAG: response regulator [Candidatus Hodarchaeales archaeon]|jgi:CheY-like chemotaxis protein
MAQKINKTADMRKYELETGKNAIWKNEITKGFLKWQKGERLYDIDKERVALYVPKEMKEKWVSFVNNSNYSTLSRLVKESLEFYIQYKSSPYSEIEPTNFNLLSRLSHDLKERLTTIMAYLQLLIEGKEYSIEYQVITELKNIYTQCLSFEDFITFNFENLKLGKEKIMSNNNIEYDILIIEDNIETLNFLTRYFKSLGYLCKEARSGRKGLDLVNESKPSIILLDIILPDISGYQIVKSVRSNNDNKDIKIIFLTAVPNSEVLKQMEELGVDGLITKPFNLKDFEIIDKILQKNK